MKAAEEILKEKCIENKVYITSNEYHTVLKAMEEYRNQPLPEQTESAELTDLKQYVTNLLYAAHEVNETPFNSSRFDKWVEEHINNLNEYFAQPHQAEMPSDEEIKSQAMGREDFVKGVNWIINKIK